ncbi:hypothetical protein HELRODRAFT_179141 [Helobdella robusta]|uniref:Uncharacterized protein n=1 Tax=Helobdella robusta TaxID=6412 RepID=T1FE84_HELRO|nr:hypothetical protein HELRODRAFT_179141 [Helobdella robusta]ESN95670.1 hypothetical protein HELRODRAFT_179141 [Helobdella robusta]
MQEYGCKKCVQTWKNERRKKWKTSFTDTDVKSVFRLGKIKEGKNGKPLLIEFFDRTLNYRVLENLSKLRNADENFRRISVTHDMTKTERDQCRKLVKESKIKQSKETSGELFSRESNDKKEKNKPEILKFFCVNTRSIVNIDKRTELELYIENEQTDIIGRTESWAKESIQDSEIELNGYVMFRKNREHSKDKGQGGGVLLYINEKLTALERKDLKNDKFKDTVWCDIKNETETLCVGVCYRVPDSTKENDSGLRELIRNPTKVPYVIMEILTTILTGIVEKAKSWQTNCFWIA